MCVMSKLNLSILITMLQIRLIEICFNKFGYEQMKHANYL